jgi:pyruvate formate-lyase/glycerol dehydratase family glycyl radical enzyme
MNQRIKKLREESLNATNCINAERALLVTEFYKNRLTGEMSPPVIRAMCFKYILENKTICINDGELIVGERGPSPKATPTYPEICIHTLKDLDILNSREKVSFKVDAETRKAYEDIIIPFWTGRSNREKIMQKMTREWLDAYESGIFTEFQEQRAPGHTVLGDKIYSMGMLDIKEEIKKSIKSLDMLNDPEAKARMEELKAMEISADAIIHFSERHADRLSELAGLEMNTSRKEELLKMAEICRRVPAYKPETFHQALQYYWFVHLGVITELNPWDSFNPGRLDQHLYPFYKKELEEGTLSREKAIELLQAFWVKFNNHPAPPKVGVTAEESNTYTDFSLINLGGLTEDGEDAVNELTYFILDVIKEMRIVQPSSMVQISKKSPDLFVEKAIDIIKTGFGQPSCFNSDAIVQELTRQGKSLKDARKGGASGCVETGAFGNECYILTGYFNLPKVLEITLNNGTDPRTGRKIGLETGNPLNFKTYEDLFNAWVEQLRYFINIKIAGNDTIHELFATEMPVPFLSLLINDCIKNGRDYNAGGARYNSSYIQGVGMGSLTDSFTSLKFHVYDKKDISMEKFLEVLKDNFKNYTDFRYELLFKTPKYGNDDEYADDILKQVFEAYFGAIDGRPTFVGGKYRINLLPTTCHIYFGKVINALPDGRKAGEPLSEGISPVQGADRKGPTSVLKSAARIDHLRTGGTLLNQKFSPSFFSSQDGIKKLGQLIRGYFSMNGHHVQFNVVTAETLRQAQKEPEKYRDLIVRVAGYSDYFNDLGKDLQDEIIRRTEHERY